MSVTITKTMESIIAAITSNPMFLSVDVTEPSIDEINEIQSRYQLKPNTFKFTITCKDTDVKISIISPEEAYSKVDALYLESVNFESDTITLIKNSMDSKEIIQYVDPTTNVSTQIRGHSQLPISNPSEILQKLMMKADAIPGVVKVYAYQLIDSNKSTIINCTDGIVLNCVVTDINIEDDHNDILNTTYTPKEKDHVVQTILPKIVYEDETQHDSIIENLIGNIDLALR